MIKYIKIKNFQSHKKTVLKLHPGINGIIGQPNSGKTAVIRSILLLLKNRPTGFAYHSDFTKNPKTEIHIKPSNSKLLKFVKTKSGATYYHGKEKFKKFGKDIPDKITNSLNLEDINFGLQLGLPFLILSTPSEIARQINSVTESEVINNCIKITNEKLNKLKTKKKTLKFSIDEINTKLVRFKRLHKAKPILDKAFKYEEKIEHLEQKTEELKSIQSFISQAQRAIKNQEKPLQAKKLISKAESLQYDIENLASEMTLLENIKMLNESLKLAIKEKNKLINDYIVELEKSKVCPTCYSPINRRSIESLKKELNQ